MTTDSLEFRLEIRHCVKPSTYVWEIYSVRELKRVKRSSQSFPTRGVAMKAGKKALLRMIASSHGHLVAERNARAEPPHKSHPSAVCIGALVSISATHDEAFLIAVKHCHANR